MLREDTQRSPRILDTRNVPVPTLEEVRAIELAARRMRAQVVRNAFRSVYTRLLGGHEAATADKLGVAHGR
jgi:hypothetical protein